MSEFIQEYILEALNKSPDAVVNTSESFIITDAGVRITDQQVILGAINRLVTHSMVVYETVEEEILTLTPEGRMIAETGSHEIKVFNCVRDEKTPISEIINQLGESVAKIGIGKAIAQKWIAPAEGECVIRKTLDVIDSTQQSLIAVDTLQKVPDSTVKDLRKRKLIETIKRVHFLVQRGQKFSRNMQHQATDLTSEMLHNKKWQNTPFKAYNYSAAGLLPTGGHLHPLLKVREQYREIFFALGFSEMPTNQYVESSFWNFDALFQPQQHPSRDAHDTFFISGSTATSNSKQMYGEFMERVRKVHETGEGCDSLGYRTVWSEEEAQKNILRTHTTAVSSRMLYKLAEAAKKSKDGRFPPTKLFSIDRVFRNETLDATHLAEFHQIEGVVADYGLTLGDLVGMLKAFFARLGMTQLRFKPAFNPYTEPSMEVFALHPGLGRWIEVGNSGFFRPEMLRPLGLPAGIAIIGWGLSLERPTMIKYGIANIRDLFGHKVDLSIVQTNPICRLDK